MRIQLQEIQSILKVVWILNDQSKFITSLLIYIILVIFLDINLKAMEWQPTWFTDS